MEETIRATCTNCNQKLSIIDPARPRGTKIPLVLHCSHTICERCLMTGIREKASVTCAKCKQESKLEEPISTWSKWEDTLTESFPLNLYLLGTITVKQQQHLTEGASVRFIPAGAPVNGKKTSTISLLEEKTFAVCVECEKDADWICQTCNDFYCNQCFLKCHQFKSQSKHVKIRYASPHAKKLYDEGTKKPNDSVGCQKHGGQKIDFHCFDCDLYCCSYCVAVCEPEHIGHTVRPLSEIDKEIRYKLIVAKEEGCAQMNLITEELALVSEGFHPTYDGLAQTQFIPNPKKVLETIVNHFAFLHGRLQTLETKLIKNVTNFMHEEADNTDVTLGKLREHLNDLSFLLQETDKALKRDATIEMIPILKQLCELKEEPYLVERSDTGNPLRFVAEETVVFDLDNHFSLDIPSPRVYTFKKNDKPLLTAADMEKIAAISLAESSGNSPSGSSLCCDLSRPGSDPSLPGQPQLKPAASPAASHHSSRTSSICEGDGVKSRPALYMPAVRGFIEAKTSEPVKVSHISTLSSFYILRTPDEKFLTDLTMRIQRHMTKNKRHPSEITKNSLYLVVYGEDHRWYRGRVKEMHEDMVEVFYIDYGNSERVPKTKLRSMPKEFKNIPPMAIHCSFANIYPKANGWSPESIQWFASIVDGVVLLCRVFSVEDDICCVDLGLLPGDEINNIPLSISDAVLFLEWGQMDKTRPLGYSQDLPMAVGADIDCYSKGANIAVGETIHVLISHIESPSHFYVQQMGATANYILSILKDLNASYFQPPSVTTPLANRAIYSPIIGMACAVQFTTDQQWYRAQVTGLPGHKMVEVQYVDYGNKEIVSYTNLRRLAKRSLRIPPLATLCSLSDVTPVKDEWTKESKDFLTKITGAIVLNLFVNAKDKEDVSKLQVTMYESTDELDVNVNALLVQEGHALSTGSSSKCVEFVKPSTVLSAAAKQTMLKPKKSKDRKIKEKPSEHITGQPLVDATAAEPEVNEPDPYKLEVKLLKSQSPDSIYIAVKCHLPHIQNMSDEMQSMYSGSVPVEVDWEPGMNCACKRPSDQLWSRGVIIELVGADEAKVSLTDDIHDVVMQLAELRELEPRFGNLPIPIKCRLAGIIPTCGTNKWSTTACEFVENFVEAHQVSTYVTKQGEIENDLLPVEVFVCESYTPGPLDPTVEHWYTLNQRLVENGLAMPKRGVPKPEPTTIADVMLELGANYNQSASNSQDGTASVPQFTVTSPEAKSNEETGYAPLLVDDSSVDSDSITSFMRQGAMNCEEETLVLKWLPAMPLELDTFQAIPTYVDDEGFIYLHDYLNSIPQVKEMQAALQAEFQGSHSKPEDLYWHPGQLCIAQYHLDEHWYRAQFLQYADGDKGLVTFVDYGNIETCDVATQLRKCTFRIDVPILAHKCYLYNVTPVGVKWETESLDILHRYFVDQRCKVTTRSKAEFGKPLLISLVRFDVNLDASKLLVDGNHARFQNMEMPIAGKSEILKVNLEEPISKSLKLLCALAGHPVKDESIESSPEENLSEEKANANRALEDGDHFNTCELPTQFTHIPNQLDEENKDGLISNDDLCTLESDSDMKSKSGSESGSGSCDSELGDASKSSADKLTASLPTRRGPQSKIFETVIGPNPLLEKLSLPTFVLPDFPDTTTLSANLKLSADTIGKDCNLTQWYDIVALEENKEVEDKKVAPTFAIPSCSSQDSARIEDTNNIAYYWEDITDEDEVEVTVLGIESPAKVIVTIHTSKEVEQIQIQKFMELTNLLQTEAPKQPQLYEPSPGMPCVACFGADDVWYRAKVVEVNVEENIIVVQYVDYANYERVPFERVVAMKREWTEMPVQSRECILWHIECPSHVSEIEVITNLRGALEDRRVLAIIKEREPVFSAVLMNLDRTELAYETLLETQLLLQLD